MTTWSPGRHTVRRKTSVAAIPEANARANRPFSSAARHSSSAVRVGLPVREYSKPERRPPTPSWAYVEVAWMGTITERVAGSGSWPAGLARVAKPVLGRPTAGAPAGAALSVLELSVIQQDYGPRGRR